MSKTLIIGREGQQSEVIVDESVSRHHLSMTMSDNPQKPYHIQLIKPELKLIVNGENLFESDINESDQILIGSNRFLIDTKRLINDFSRIESHPKEELIISKIIHKDKIEIQSVPEDNDSKFSMSFYLVNALIIVLFIFSCLIKSNHYLYIVTLIVLLLSVAVSIYLYAKNKN